MTLFFLDFFSFFQTLKVPFVLTFLLTISIFSSPCLRGRDVGSVCLKSIEVWLGSQGISGYVGVVYLKSIEFGWDVKGLVDPHLYA